VWIAWVGWTVAGFGIGLAYPMQSVVVLERSAPSEQGTNSSALQLNETLTTSAALGVIGAVFASLIGQGAAGYTVAFAAAAFFAATAALVSRRTI